MSTMDQVRLHYNKVTEYLGGSEKLLGVFLYGSQNYGISTDNSDVDTKAIVIPDIKDLCLNQPICKELHLANNEHCEIKDIREMSKMFSKQNINFLEILYTDYCLINPKYNRIWRKYFINNREMIAHMDMRKALFSICGQAIHTLNKNGINGKNFANGLRLYHTLKKYIEGENYDKCINIIFHEKELVEKLISYKKNLIPVTENDVNNLIGKFLWVESMSELYPKTPDNKASRILNEGVLALITNENLNIDFYQNLSYNK